MQHRLLPGRDLALYPMALFELSQRPGERQSVPAVAAQAGCRRVASLSEADVVFSELEAHFMINVFRKHQKWLMIVIAILAIPFVFYFNKTDVAAMRAGRVARLYGRDVSNVELQRDARFFELARDLGMFDFLRDLIASAQTEQQAKEQFALNLIIIRHEAGALGVQPTPAEIADALKKLPAFHGKNGFDMQKYNDAVQNYLGPRGFSEGQLEELVSDQVSLERIKQLVGTGAVVSPAEVQKDFDSLYSKLQVSLVRFKTADVANEVKISDDDMKKYYDADKESLKSEEKRRVQFLALTLSEPEKKLTGKERVDALQKLSDKANDVVQALGEKAADFNAVAAKFHLPVSTTGDFTQAAPDPQLKVDAQLAQTAFQLSEADPVSEPVQGADGFYILKLAGITPPKQLTIEEAKSKIVDALKARQERELLNTRAAKVAHDLRDALKSGSAVANAAQKANVKLEPLPPFTLADELKPAPQSQKSPEIQTVKNAVVDLHANDVTEPIPTADGMLVAVVEKRDAPDPAQAAANRASLQERVERGKRTMVFYEWLQERRRVAGIVETPEAG
jgi:peptidyl-prolyl cis-trans isomerase D